MRLQRVKNFINLTLEPFDFARSKQKLQKTEQEILSKDANLFQIPFVFNGYGLFHSIRPKQVVFEIKELYELVKSHELKYVCEIGTYQGGTFYLWCKAATDNAMLISIDLPSKTPLEPFSDKRIKFYHHFAKDEQQQLHFLAADSHQQSTADKVASILGKNQLDFLFIDGDHSYAGVKQDFELYKPLVRPGGMIAFHDLLPRKDCPGIEVYRLWNEIKSNYRHQEIIAQDGSYANLIGIGIIWID
ncbi:class I SAM-dependent methyltransferase [Cyanobacteria bacterium FACHB-472]|nr:class I SAM-dependent methyltransferase [Cyanobacteria bacterium FACHB-472]